MGDKQAKLIRGQLRQIVKELLPEILTTESFMSLQKTLDTRLNNKVDNITRMVRDALEKLDQRSKDMQSYVVRNVGVPTAPSAPQVDPTLQSTANRG